MPPKVKVIESGDLGHGVTFEVRPASKGSPTVHVVVDGQRLPAFRLKPDASSESQVRSLPAVQAKLVPSAVAMDVDNSPSFIAQSQPPPPQPPLPQPPLPPMHKSQPLPPQSPPPQPPPSASHKFQRELKSTAAAAATFIAAANQQQQQQLEGKPKRRCYECCFCHSLGQTLFGIVPAEAAEGAQVIDCTTCMMMHCNVKCERRGPCR